MFEKLKGVEHITKVVTLIVKGEEYDCLGIMLGTIKVISRNLRRKSWQLKKS